MWNVLYELISYFWTAAIKSSLKIGIKFVPVTSIT